MVLAGVRGQRLISKVEHARVAPAVFEIIQRKIQASIDNADDDAFAFQGTARKLPILIGFRCRDGVIEIDVGRTRRLDIDNLPGRLYAKHPDDWLRSLSWR
jgi:hypothetical protein